MNWKRWNKVQKILNKREELNKQKKRGTKVKSNAELALPEPLCSCFEGERN